MVPTLFGILLINFVVIQALPGGPVQQMISELSGRGVGATARVTGGGGNEAMGGSAASSGQADAAAIAARRGWTRRSSTTSSGSSASTSRPGSAS